MDDLDNMRVTPETAYEVAVDDIMRGHPISDVLRVAVGTLAGWNEYHAERCAELERKVANLAREVAQLRTEVRNSRGYGFVYIFQGDGYYKIGYSQRPPRRRLQISPKLPFDLRVVCVVESLRAQSLESQLHVRFEDKRLRGEWFNLDDDDLVYIKSLGAKDGQGTNL